MMRMFGLLPTRPPQVKKAQVMKLVQEVNPSHGGTVDFETYLEISACYLFVWCLAGVASNGDHNYIKCINLQ